MLTFKLCFLAVFSLFILNLVKSDSVCDLNTLIVEIRQDLADNGMLDCQRVIEAPHFVEETEDQKNLRLAAQWDTSCSFEASANWQESLKRLDIGSLVDSTGEFVKSDFEDQADMCEIVRAAVAQGLFEIPDMNMQKLPDDIVDKIDCAGIKEEKSGPRICAASGSSFFQKDSWTIFLDSSVIKFGGKPEFVVSDEQPQSQTNPYAGNKSLQTNLIKDLLKFSKDQLESKEGEIANMIDKADESNDDSSSSKKEEVEKDLEKDKSKEVHVHLKKVNDVALVNSNGKYLQLDQASEMIKVDETRIVFGYYMASYKLEKAGKVGFKINFNGREIPETRQNLGDVELGTATSAFAEVFNPKSEDVEFKVLFNSNESGTMNSSTSDQSFAFGVVTFPEGEVFKHVNSAELSINKSERWTDLSGFELNIKYSGKKETNFLIMYNFALPRWGTTGTLHTRLNLNSKGVAETTATCGPVNEVGIHSGIVVKVQPGTTIAKLEYKYPEGDNVSINEFSDTRFVQSMNAFQLPETAEVANYKLEKTLSLDTSNEWKGFELGANISLSKKKTILILYSINLKVDKASFAARVRFDTKFNKKSTVSNSGLDYTHAQGYVVKVLKAGKYTIDIDFKSDAKTTYDPQNSELDGQMVSLQVIQLD
jgi:hypothetical protein